MIKERASSLSFASAACGRTGVRRGSPPSLPYEVACDMHYLAHGFETCGGGDGGVYRHAGCDLGREARRNAFSSKQF